jgi:hypothetical protein
VQLLSFHQNAPMQDYSLAGHQIVCHLVASDYGCLDFVNPVGTGASHHI